MKKEARTESLKILKIKEGKHIGDSHVVSIEFSCVLIVNKQHLFAYFNIYFIVCNVQGLKSMTWSQYF